MDQTVAALGEYKSSYRHLAWSFRRSRDKWKDKHQRLKRQHKRLQNQLRAVTASRDNHKQSARLAGEQVEQSQQRIEHLQQQVEHLQQQLHDAQTGEKRGALAAYPSPGNNLRPTTVSLLG